MSNATTPLSQASRASPNPLTKGRLHHELTRSCALRGLVISELESVLERYSEGRRQLGLLTQAEEEAVKVGRLHTKMIESLLVEASHFDRESTEQAVDQDVVLQCRDLLSHQRDLRESLAHELRVKEDMLREKTESNDEIRRQIDSIERKGYRTARLRPGEGMCDDGAAASDSSEGRRRGSISIDNHCVLNSQLPEDTSHDEWLAQLRLNQRVTLSSVLGCEVTEKGEPMSKAPKHLEKPAAPERPAHTVLQEEELVAADELQQLASLRSMVELSQEVSSSLKSSLPFTSAEKYAIVYGPAVPQEDAATAGQGDSVAGSPAAQPPGGGGGGGVVAAGGVAAGDAVPSASPDAQGAVPASAEDTAS